MQFINDLIESFMAVMRTFRFKDAVDITIIGFAIYYVMKLLRETRAVQLVKGIFVLIVIYGIANIFRFTMMTALLSRFFEFAVIVIFILFQPEIRKFLEQLGRSNYTYRRLTQFFEPSGKGDDLPPISKYLSIYIEGIDVLKKSKTGALIVFERRTPLGDIADTGTVIKAAPSINIMGNIFFNKAPLHDGAMIVRDGMVYAAGCILPLTHDHKHVDDHLGTRHRAAIGISEVSDAVVVVVSEETGSVSIALNGEITRDYTKESLEKELYRLLIGEESRSSGRGVIINKLKMLKRRSERRSGKKTDSKNSAGRSVKGGTGEGEQ